MARRPGALVVITLWGLGCASAAPAQTIPLPTPAPLPKVYDAKPMPPTNIGGTSHTTSSIANGIKSFFNIGKPNESITLDANQRALVEKVSGYLSNLRTLVGDFTQVGPNGTQTRGQLYLQKPGRVRFEYADPNPIQLIADGQSVVVRDRKLATQDLYPLSQTPLRFILADRVDLLRDTQIVGVSLDDVFATVIIKEESLGGSHKVMLMFGAQDLTLKQWTITDPQGYETTVAVYNLDTSKRPDPSLFKINYEVNNTNVGNN